MFTPAQALSIGALIFMSGIAVYYGYLDHLPIFLAAIVVIAALPGRAKSEVERLRAQLRAYENGGISTPFTRAITDQANARAAASAYEVVKLNRVVERQSRRIKKLRAEKARHVACNAAQPTPKHDEERIAEAVNRFLCWRLPDDFAPDSGISYTPITRQPGWLHDLHPTGTNLFNAAQAKAMFEHCLATQPTPKHDEGREAEAAAEAWLTATARKAGPHGVSARDESLMRLGYQHGYLATQPAARRVTCHCVDCGGDQPRHSNDCTHMRELHGESLDQMVEAIRTAPFGTTTVGDVICAEVTWERLRPAMRAALESFAQPQSVPDEGNAGVPAEGVSVLITYGPRATGSTP